VAKALNMSNTTAARSSWVAVFLLMSVVLAYAVDAKAQQSATPVATIVGSVADAEDAIIHILMIDEKSKIMNSGTAFFISSTGYLLTAAHILNSDHPGLRPFAHTRDGKDLLVSVLRIDTELDVAVLYVPIQTRKYFALSDNALVEVGKRVTFGGFPERYSEQRGIPSVSFRRAAVSAVDTVSMGPQA
jgi:hypothetical protein